LPPLIAVPLRVGLCMPFVKISRPSKGGVKLFESTCPGPSQVPVAVHALITPYGRISVKTAIVGGHPHAASMHTNSTSYEFKSTDGLNCDGEAHPLSAGGRSGSDCSSLWTPGHHTPRLGAGPAYTLRTHAQSGKTCNCIGCPLGN